jgi:hypothetical protein
MKKVMFIRLLYVSGNFLSGSSIVGFSGRTRLYRVTLKIS